MQPFALLSLAAATTAVAAAARVLPPQIIAGYTNWCECDDNITLAVENGVNVLFWFSINLLPAAAPSSCLNLSCISSIASQLRARNLTTTHLVTVGGWDAAHPAGASGAEFYALWKAWNEGVIATVLPGGFDGIDWDLEGNDNVTSPFNTLGATTLDIVGQFSEAAKADGYLVSLVPPESYFDVSTSLFDSSLLHPYPEWKPDFAYHGHNPYSYIWSRYNAAFDFVTVQLYESWAHADFNITVAGQRPADYLVSWINNLAAGWVVDFSSDPTVSWPTQRVSVDPSRLLIGLANGWAGGYHPKSLLIMPEEVGAAYAVRPFRGAAFWCIASEGAIPPLQSEKLFLAAGLNSILKTRDT